jgi:hypothetical protein
MPRAELIFDEAALSLTRDEILRRLLDGAPAISLAAAGESGVFINPQTLEPGEEKIIVEKIHQIVFG